MFFKTNNLTSNLFQDLGYDRQLGYQTFMYGTEKDIRHLLSFLVSKLPKGAAESSESSGSLEYKLKHIYI